MKLYDKLPNEITVNKKTYKIDMSFNNILLIIDMMKDKKMSDLYKIITGLKMLFIEEPQLPLDEKVELWHKSFGTLVSDYKKEPDWQYDIKGNKIPVYREEKEQTLCLSQDAELIYASFLQDYGIDLFEEQGKMHWYKFLALINGLSENTTLKKVIQIRQMPLPSGKGSQKHRAEIEKLKKHYAIKKDGEY